MQNVDIFRRRPHESGPDPDEIAELGRLLRDLPIRPKILKDLHYVDTLIQQLQKN